MNDTRKRLLKYREAKEQQLASQLSPEKIGEKSSSQNSHDENMAAQTPSTKELHFYDYLAIDLLNCYPMRKWREFCHAFPLQCWVFTASVCSLFILMFLNLGVRKEGELSAYSVFNPNCERLLGQITSDHFERDMLLRNNVREEN